MFEVYFSLGTNLEPRNYYISKAEKLLEKNFGEIFKKSSVYETEAWGYSDKKYLNKIVSYKTNIAPHKILEIINNIEKKLGRKNKTRKDEKGKFIYSARTIDIDILFSGSEIIKSKKLTIPHLQLHKRNFILTPMNEIAPDFIHPVLRKKISCLNKNCPDKMKVKLLK